VSTSNSAATGLSVNQVELYLDGALYATSTASPFSFSWDTLDARLSSYDGVAHSLTTKVYDPSASSQLNYPVDVTVTNNSAASWDTTFSMVYYWYDPNLGNPDPVTNSGTSVGTVSLLKGKTTTIRAQVAPPAPADGVDAAQFRLRVDVVQTLQPFTGCISPPCTTQVPFATQGNPPLGVRIRPDFTRVSPRAPEGIPLCHAALTPAPHGTRVAMIVHLIDDRLYF